MIALTEKNCHSPEGSAPLSDAEEDDLMKQIRGWKLIRGEPHRIEREFQCSSFARAMAFANRAAQLAESEHHHPKICISYDKVTIQLSTHKIDGLHENDFIMAAKITGLYM